MAKTKTIKRNGQQKASDPRTQESQRRHRVEGVVQEIMHDLSANGVHAGAVLNELVLEYIAASFRSAISKAERGAYIK